MRAVTSLVGLTLDGAELAALCQRCENQVVGAPCGIMDQMTSALGRANQLLVLRCQPAEVQGFMGIPEGVKIWGIDSDVRHAVSGSDYTSVRVGAFMGYRIIAERAGLKVTGRTAQGAIQIDDTRWGGYLANITPGEFGSEFSSQLPERLGGREFLNRFGGVTDPVTRVDPSREYAVWQPTFHPIAEHDRVRRFAELLSYGDRQEALVEMGELMYASHASYTACGLGSEATDRIVEMVREAGPGHGLYGAKITGGGSGGTVAVLGSAEAGDQVAGLAEQYAAQTGRRPVLFRGSSVGAYPSGTRWLGEPVV
jgi:L-arabinokinase